MKKIKIISNPYKQEILFEEWSNADQKWKPIYEGGSKGKLLKDEIRNGFFPFKVSKILDAIRDEFYINEKIEIYFEGTPDEYFELEELLSGENYSQYFNLCRIERYLKNARDILPEIRDIFENRIMPLIDENMENREAVNEDTRKFADAANEVIPVCVLGTYSVGKSTFVNSLIGREILPSAEKPTTAKVYKISEAEEEDRAEISLTYGNEDIKIAFENDRLNVTSSDNELIEKVKSRLEKISGDDIYVKLNKILEIINDYSREDSDLVGDAIEISVPFKRGLWKDSANKFVIFDTPGSNSASNKRHLEVLKNELAGLTNGIPVFVTKFDQLDTTDNAALYNEIANIEELDRRFTMIVINKADESKLPKEGFSQEEREDILHQEIPREMYKGGIYFISSIMGLGSKNDGEFLDDHSGEIFEDQRNKYINPESKYYKTLYKYNIMPVQMKERLMAEAGEYEDVMFANSGCYSVEKEIQTFAAKYSAYNKCTQANVFLENVIDITTEDIETNRREKDAEKVKRDDQLDKDKTELIHKIEDSNEESEKLTEEELASLTTVNIEKHIEKLNFGEIIEMTRDINSINKEEQGLDKEKKDVLDAVKDTGASLGKNMKKAIVNKDKEGVARAYRIAKAGARRTLKETMEVIDTKKNVSEASRKDLKNIVTGDLVSKINEGMYNIESESIRYLEGRTAEIKRNLIVIIRGQETISEDKRKELEDIVINYPELDIPKSAEYISEDKLKNKIELTYALTLRKQFNNAMKKEITAIGESIQSKHFHEFLKWLHELESIIVDDIENYSPALHRQRERITELAESIEKLKNCKKALMTYRNEIISMMEWISD